MGRIVSQVKDQAGFFELLTTFVAQIKSLTPGACLVLPGGFKGGLLLYVLHMDSFEEFTLGVCSTGDGLEYHPTRIDPASGDAQFNSPLLIWHIPAHRVRDGSLWFLLLRSALFADATPRPRRATCGP